MDLSNVRSHADVNVTVEFTQDEQVKATYRSFHIVPDWMSVKYAYDAASGWWKATSVTLVGQKVLKPAADGTRRLGKDKGKATYGGWAKGVQEAGDLPEWVDQLVSELRPSGAVTLPAGG